MKGHLCMHKLIKLREKWGISQFSMSKVINVSLVRYRKLEKCQTVEELKDILTVREMEEIAKFFQVTTDELFYEKKQKKG